MEEILLRISEGVAKNYAIPVRFFSDSWQGGLYSLLKNTALSLNLGHINKTEAKNKTGSLAYCLNSVTKWKTVAKGPEPNKCVK